MRSGSTSARHRPRRVDRRLGRRPPRGGGPRRPQRLDLAAPDPVRAAHHGVDGRARGARAQRGVRLARRLDHRRGLRRRRGLAGNPARSLAHARVRRRDRDPLGRRRPGLLPERRQAPDAEGGRHGVGDPGSRLPRDRRARIRRPPARAPRRERTAPRPLDRGRDAPPRQVGDGLVVADRRRADRSPARLERGHSRVPLVGQGARPHGRVLRAEGRPGDREAAVDGQGAPARGRREPLEHVLGRRAALVLDDLHAATGRTGTPSAPAQATSRTSRTLSRSCAPSC